MKSNLCIAVRLASM